jgi:hypothetical protein
MKLLLAYALPNKAPRGQGVPLAGVYGIPRWRRHALAERYTDKEKGRLRKRTLHVSLQGVFPVPSAYLFDTCIYPQRESHICTGVSVITGSWRS